MDSSLPILIVRTKTRKNVFLNMYIQLCSLAFYFGSDRYSFFLTNWKPGLTTTLCVKVSPAHFFITGRKISLNGVSQCFLSSKRVKCSSKVATMVSSNTIWPSRWQSFFCWTDMNKAQPLSPQGSHCDMLTMSLATLGSNPSGNCKASNGWLRGEEASFSVNWLTTSLHCS